MKHGSVRRALVSVAGTMIISALGSARAAAQGGSRHAGAGATSAGGTTTPSATVEKPRVRSVSGGMCRVLSDGTLGGTWGPSSLPILAFTVGPGSVMADQLHANKAPFTGPGKYANVIVAVYLGKTAMEDAYLGLGTITVNADDRSGSFVLNDGSASGHWNCGQKLR